MKTIRRIIRDIPRHWVGDGFPVRSLFSYAAGNRFDPFLLLDYAGPHSFPPAESPRGVGEHPHRGFETVTLIYQGELDLPDGHTAVIVVRSAAVRVLDEMAEALAVVELDRAGTFVRLASETPAQLLVLTGQPIDEPVVGEGPFVMNTKEEIRQAVIDYRDGRMGQLGSRSD